VATGKETSVAGSGESVLGRYEFGVGAGMRPPDKLSVCHDRIGVINGFCPHVIPRGVCGMTLLKAKASSQQITTNNYAKINP
jgi:hypothetical protein